MRTLCPFGLNWPDKGKTHRCNIHIKTYGMETCICTCGAERKTPNNEEQK